MGIETKTRLRAGEILKKAGLSTNSSYYAGRGATYYDLELPVLVDVHQMVLENYGKIAADNMAKMVSDLPEARADDFVSALFRMERNGWDWFNELGYGFPSRISKIIPEDDAAITRRVKESFLLVTQCKTLATQYETKYE